eukprot:TRINITY_DN1944_c0_g1_i1.p1 TRINITY_DN1944_c0_g1~~TRINITY_DN1944_c0_g1_i1.p1  ORF type:complete len:1818 (+),score=434.22 TRINITY_DN1944_c0_g1_i1:104-5455(+)
MATVVSMGPETGSKLDGNGASPCDLLPPQPPCRSSSRRVDRSGRSRSYGMPATRRSAGGATVPQAGAAPPRDEHLRSRLGGKRGGSTGAMMRRNRDGCGQPPQCQVDLRNEQQMSTMKVEDPKKTKPRAKMLVELGSIENPIEEAKKGGADLPDRKHEANDKMKDVITWIAAVSLTDEVVQGAVSDARSLKVKSALTWDVAYTFTGEVMQSALTRQPRLTSENVEAAVGVAPKDASMESDDECEDMQTFVSCDSFDHVESDELRFFEMASLIAKKAVDVTAYNFDTVDYDDEAEAKAIINVEFDGDQADHALRKQVEAILTESDVLEATQSKASPIVSVEAARRAARQTLLQASSSGTLLSALMQGKGEAQKDETNELREAAMKTLIGAVGDGRLEHAFRHNVSPPRPTVDEEESHDLKHLARNTLMDAAMDGRLEAAFQAARSDTGFGAQMEVDDLDSMRCRAKDALLTNLKNHRLEQEIDRVRATREETSLRCDARRTLLSASLDGSLVDAFKQIKASRRQSVDQQELADAKRATRNALVSGLNDGRLAAALRSVPEPQTQAADQEVDMERVRLQARFALVNGVKDGRLAAALRRDEVPPLPRDKELEARAAARDALVNGLNDRRLAAALRSARQTNAQEVDLEMVRLQARRALVEGARDGRLAAALRLGDAPASTGTKENIEMIRLQTRDALIRGLQDGRLAVALRRDKEDHLEDVEMIRVQARDALVGGLKDGRLAAALRRDKALSSLRCDETVNEDNCEVQIQVRDALVSGLSDGRLAKALRLVTQTPAVKNEDSNNVRMQVREALVNGLHNGRLEAAFRPSEVVTIKDVDAARVRIRDTLSKAAVDGSLCRAIRSVPEKQSSTVAEEAENVEELRCQARDLLLGAVADGRLSSALSTVKKGSRDSVEEEDGDEELRNQLRGLFLNAVSDGRLSTVLQEAQAEAGATSELSADEEDDVEDIETLRNLAASSFLRGASDGRLKLALHEVAASRAELSEEEILRAEVLSTLASAADDGRLARSLSIMKESREKAVQEAEIEELRCSVRDTLLTGLNTGSLYDALRASVETSNSEEAALEKELEDARSMARNILVETLHNGQLETAITEIHEARRQKRQDEELDDARSLARSILVETLENGELETAIIEMHEARRQKREVEELDDARSLARSILVETLENGQLETAIIEMHEARRQKREVEEARLLMRDTIFSAAVDGRLATALGNLKTTDVAQFEEESLRRNARDAFLAGARDGRLRDALQEVKLMKPTPVDEADQETLRRNVRKAFLAGAMDGRLRDALEEVKLTKATAVDDVDQEESLRRKARNAFLAGARDGRLRDALQEVKSTPVDGMDQDTASLRHQLCSTLLKAAVTGDLENAVNKLIKARESSEEDVKMSSNSLQHKVQDALLKATADGRLGSILSEKACQSSRRPQVSPLDLDESVSDNGSCFADITPPQTCQRNSATAEEKSMGVGIASLAVDSMHKAEARIAALEVANAATQPRAQEEEDTPRTHVPKTPVKSRRRIIGAVVRPDALSPPTLPHCEDLVAPIEVSKTSRSRKHRHSSESGTPSGHKRSSRPTSSALMFQMDDQPTSPKLNARESSLTRGYDALDVQVFAMHDFDEISPRSGTPSASAPLRPYSTPSTPTRPASSCGGVDAFGMLGSGSIGRSDLHSSSGGRRGAALRHHRSASALMADLGDESLSGSRLASQNRDGSSFATPPPSSPAGSRSLKVSKSSPSFLPAINGSTTKSLPAINSHGAKASVGNAVGWQRTKSWCM